MIGGGYAQTTLIQQFSQQCGTAAVGKRNEEQIQRSQAFFFCGTHLAQHGLAKIISNFFLVV